MSFHFATCDPRRALEFIQQFYMVTKDDIPELMALFKEDKARVTDPNFHTCQVALGQKGTNADIPAIRKACQVLVGREITKQD